MLKRSTSRAPSPTPTAFSNISTYRNDSYRAKAKDQQTPPIDYRAVSRTHFAELGRYLTDYLAKAPPNSRTTARQKLTRLTIQQFHELSTDVYDELIRRQNGNEVPFLPVKEEFHPKRNQARQKLATLPASRFEDLSSDVYFELARRYPEFKEDPSGGDASPSSNYEDYPAPGFPSASAAAVASATSPPRGSSSRISGRTSADRSESSRRPSIDKRRQPSEDYPMPRRSEDNYRRPDDPYNVGSRMMSMSGDEGFSSGTGGGPASRRKPSQDTIAGRRSEDRERERANEGAVGAFGHRPNPSASISGRSDSTMTVSGNNANAGGGVGGTNVAQSATAMSGMIIPTKSRMEEEDIKIPYAQDRRESGSTTMDERSAEGHATGGVGVPGGMGMSGVSSVDRYGYSENEPDSASDYHGMSPKSPPAGLGGLVARLRNAEESDEVATSGGIVGSNGRGRSGSRDGDEYYDKYGRSSVNSDRSTGGGGNAGLRMMLGRNSVPEDYEKLRREYEGRIVLMQSQISGLQKELKEAAADKGELEAKMQEKTKELEGIRWHLEEQTSTVRSLQQELEELRELRQRDKERESRRMQDESDELNILRHRVEELEKEKENVQMQADQHIVEQLRSDVEGLVMELNDLSKRNDELLAARENDLNVIRDLDVQMKEYKRKYEQAKTELRNIKATSQLYAQAPRVDRIDDQLPVSSDGGILDIHVTAFVSAVDSLLTAGRGNSPTRVLIPMKAVVNAMTNIIEDVRTFERRNNPSANVNVDNLRAFRDRAEATLSNLVAASKTHATSSGMSPVSLLDAAASHVASTVTEIGRIVKIRRATRAEQEQFANTYVIGAGPSSSSSPPSQYGYGPGHSSSPSQNFMPMRTIEEVHTGAGSPARKGSVASVSSRTGAVASVGKYGTGTDSPGAHMRRPTSDLSSSEQTNSPPPIFDRQTNANASSEIVSDDSGVTEGSEDAWSELKSYLDAQTESIVFAIQSVLSGVRNPTPSLAVLDENITQIITIVSSIVAVCKDNLPPQSVQQGTELLQELSEHANKLSEVQVTAELTKESRQTMAKSSFAIANAMKGLMKL